MTDDLVAWLREQIAETKRVAAEACDNDLTRSSWRSEHPNTDRVEARVMQRHFLVAPDVTDATARHIALNDPDAVLAQCDAYEAILCEHWDVNEGDCAACVTGHWGYPTHGGSSPQQYPCKTVRALALAYRNRDGYRAEWKP